ncbi:DUF7365 family protein [Streptococcus gallolyticus]|uniref:DUF7365 domain-containing protein n=1 Tax=Streptococcus gallolyticus TaxID=315405 RepID=A0A1H9VQ84_9STRE|nr:hypothetical protein [Streptococcus gallolyticus]SES23960.1 hypothetical protein SAMN04487840_1304 [Streptococcus gallolyticus]
MAEKELMHWLMTTVFPIALSTTTLYITTRNNTANLEHRLTELETINKSQEKLLDMHSSRLDKHDEEQKMMLGMIEQIRNLTENVSELKADLKEIKEKIS